METLEEKFEVYRDVILSDLDISDDLLKVMIERGLLDAAESAKYKVIPEIHERNLELMTAMIERRTDRAYPILLDCLRKSGQDRIADLLTDVTLDTDVDHKSPDAESKRSASPERADSPSLQNPSEIDLVREVNANLDALLNDLSPFLTIEERRIGLEIKDTSKRALEGERKGVTSHHEDQSAEAESQQAERQLWHSVHDTMVTAMSEIGRCQAVIKKLHNDCQTVADINSEITAQIKDCDSIIRGMLMTHRLPAVDVPAPQRTTEVFQTLMDNVRTLTESRNRVMLREKETRSQSMRLLRMLRDLVDERSHVLSHLHSTLTSTRRVRYPLSSARLSINSPFTTSLATSPATSRHGQSPPVSRETELASLIEPRPISSVNEGLYFLEHQLKEYIRLESFLTDKFKAELRVKHLQKKAQGYTSKGFYSVKQYVDGIEHGVEVEENVDKLKGVLVKLSEEYDQCVSFMKRTTSTMSKLSEDPQQKPEKKPTFRFGKKKPKEADVPVLKLPKLVPENTFSNLDFPGDSVRGKPLLLRLKTLVSNYESLKDSEKSLKQRLSQDFERKRKDLIQVIRKKEEEILNIDFQLKEMTGDRDKYRKLYEQAKASVGRKG